MLYVNMTVPATGIIDSQFFFITHSHENYTFVFNKDFHCLFRSILINTQIVCSMPSNRQIWPNFTTPVLIRKSQDI